MRFPMRFGRIDEAASDKLLLEAARLGVNYLDTGWPYHLGQSEKYLGSFFTRTGMRDQFYVATKMPTWAIKRPGDMDNYLDRQLAKLQSTHIDYYLLHMLIHWSRWERLKELGVLDFIKRAKADGRIHHIGFSFHGDQLTFKKIIDDYPWDFAQIQYNILDENNQAGTAGLVHAREKGIPVMVMEPLRGGLLGNQVPKKASKILKAANPDRSPAAWFLRWVMEKEGVVTVLSGMNELSHLVDNCKTADEATIGCMSQKELKAIERVKTIYHEAIQVPCTGCQYCMPCPFGVNIPRNFEIYNNHHIFPNKPQRINYLLWFKDTWHEPMDASLCKNCGKCLEHCPQHIDIPNRLKDVEKKLNRWYLKASLPLIRLYMGAKRKKNDSNNE